MKEQYVGDVNDYRKYALLRRLSSGGRVKIGVCWMLTPPDGRSDGNKVDYLQQPERWGGHDPELFELLCDLRGRDDVQRLRKIERRKTLLGARYFNEFVPTHPDLRAAYFRVALDILGGVDLIFFDPDNGIEIASKPKGRDGSAKFIYRDEIEMAFSRGHSILIYQHFMREQRDITIRRLTSQFRHLSSRIWAYRTPDASFLLLIHPASSTELRDAAKSAAASWPANFLYGEEVVEPSTCD